MMARAPVLDSGFWAVRGFRTEFEGGGLCEIVRCGEDTPVRDTVS
jgi:hypothetical protein